MKDRVKSFRDLRVWQKGIELVPPIYELVEKLPVEERYALGNQIRRAVVSVPANIAEGQARQHRKEFLQSLFIARGSLAELETLLEVARRLRYLEPGEVEGMDAPIREVRRMLQGLINALTN